MISVLILTKNEEHDLQECIESVSWCDDIHIFDSFSDDATVQIALAHGANVLQRQFDGYASQRNAAIKLCNFKYNWTFVLDADERSTEALVAEMIEFVTDPKPEVVACRIKRRDFFMGKHLKHAQISPYYIRLFKPSHVHYEREINEILRVDGKIFDLNRTFDHYPFSKGLSHWIDKHNQYSTREARHIIEASIGEVAWSPWKTIFNSDFNERRFHQKVLFYRLPFRPFLKYIYIVLCVELSWMDMQA